MSTFTVSTLGGLINTIAFTNPYGLWNLLHGDHVFDKLLWGCIATKWPIICITCYSQTYSALKKTELFFVALLSTWGCAAIDSRAT